MKIFELAIQDARADGVWSANLADTLRIKHLELPSPPRERV